MMVRGRVAMKRRGDRGDVVIWGKTVAVEMNGNDQR